VKIPDDVVLREAFYYDLINQCFASRQDRLSFYRQMRSYYMGGAEEGRNAQFNKIGSGIDLLTSYLFASETTKFSVKLDEEAPREEMAKLRPLSRKLNDEWHRSNTDMVFGDALTWSLVYGTEFIKLIPKKGAGILPFLVEPSQIGVLREDKNYLDRQEAIAMKYTITKTQLERELELVKHPRRAKILQEVSTGRGEETGLPAAVQRIILSQSTPNMIGQVNWMAGGDFYRPKVQADMVDMVELWVWDDDIHDYRTVTMAEPGVCVYDRENIFLPVQKDETGKVIKATGEHPFVQVCPRPLPYYLWGASEVAPLIALQDARERRMAQISEMLDKNARPPKALMGMTGIPDEQLLALNLADGFAQFPDMTTKIESFKPEMSSDMYAEVKVLDEMFMEALSLSNIMQGKGEHGVRSRGQTSELARLGAARIKKRAMIVEDSLEKLASLMLRCIRTYDSEALKDEKGQPFIPAQSTSDLTVKVDAHSNSPIFVEDQRELAMWMLEHKLITRQAFLEMTQPPMQQQLIQDLQTIEKQEAEAAQREQSLEMAKAQGGKASLSAVK
jgi:hypothetical protein